MAGHMGTARVTTQNLQVVRIDTDRGLVMVKGAVPGNKGGWVTVKDAVKKPQPENVIMPGRAALGRARGPAPRRGGRRRRPPPRRRPPRRRRSRPRPPPRRPPWPRPQASIAADKEAADPNAEPQRRPRPRPQPRHRRRRADTDGDKQCRPTPSPSPARPPAPWSSTTRSSASSRAPTSCTAWSAGSAPSAQQGTHSTLARVGGQLLDQEDLPPEGHRRRTPRLQEGADLPARRRLQGPQAPQPRPRPDQEVPRASGCMHALSAKAQGGRARRDRGGGRWPRPRPGRWPSSSPTSAGSAR